MLCNEAKIIIRYAEGSLPFEMVYEEFVNMDCVAKKIFWEELFELIQQSNCQTEDVSLAIERAELKQTYNCCVVIRKGIYYHNLQRIMKLNENLKSLKLLLNLFKIGYLRKRTVDTTPGRWWNITV